MNVDKIIDCLILYNDQVESEMSIAKEIADYFLSSTYKCNFLGADNKQ